MAVAWQCWCDHHVTMMAWSNGGVIISSHLQRHDVRAVRGLARPATPSAPRVAAAAPRAAAVAYSRSFTRRSLKAVASLASVTLCVIASRAPMRPDWVNRLQVPEAF